MPETPAPAWLFFLWALAALAATGVALLALLFIQALVTDAWKRRQRHPGMSRTQAVAQALAAATVARRYRPSAHRPAPRAALRIPGPGSAVHAQQRRHSSSRAA